MIAIVDYGCGNLGSIANMFKKIGVKAIVTSDVSDLELADKIVLPGVGAFDVAMTNIQNSGLLDVLHHKALVEGVPFLGICLGMQILLSESEEGDCKGLGWIDGKVKKFSHGNHREYKSTHMGWNAIKFDKNIPLMHGLTEVAENYDTTRFYFVHSYYAEVANQAESMSKTNYGLEFDSSIYKDNIYGVQFHPEKSHKFGMKLLANFSGLN